MKKQAWHTEGYQTIADAFVYLSALTTFVSKKDKDDAIAILQYAGILIRKEHDETLR